MFFGNQPLDHRNDPWDFTSGPWSDGWPQDVECSDLFVPVVDQVLDEGAWIEAFGVRPGNYLVVNVGKILSVTHLIAQMDEITTDHVEYNREHSVTDVRRVVNRDAANIHSLSLIHISEPTRRT